MRGHGSQSFHIQIEILTRNKSLEPFRIYLLNSTDNPVNLHQNWVGLAELFSRQILGSQDFFDILIYFLSMKPLRAMPAHFWHLLAVGTVVSKQIEVPSLLTVLLTIPFNKLLCSFMQVMFYEAYFNV